MEISLPESLQRVLQAKAAQGHFGTVEEYVHAVLSREAQQEPVPSENELDRFHDKLRRSGLLRPASASPTPRLDEPFEPIPIAGPPLSESIIAERR